LPSVVISRPSPSLRATLPLVWCGVVRVRGGYLCGLSEVGLGCVAS